MNKRVEQIINHVTMYEKVEETGTSTKVHEVVIHELHMELDSLYNTVDTKVLKEELKELEKYAINLEDYHKKELLHEIIMYLEMKV